MSNTEPTPAERVAWHFRFYYRAAMEDVAITDTPGYWKYKQSCGGRGVCPAPIHACLFNEGPIRHTLSYFDPGRDPRTGRWQSTTRTWRIMRESAQQQGA